MPPQDATAFLGQIDSLAQQGQVEAVVQGMQAHRQDAKVQRKAFEMSTPTWEATLSECEEMIVTVRPKALA